MLVTAGGSSEYPLQAAQERQIEKGKKTHIDTLSTHPETILHVWDTLFDFQGSTAPQALLKLLDLNWRQADVSYVGVKVHLWLAIFASLG